MYKFFTLFASLAIALYFFSDPLLQMFGSRCGEEILWYCNLPQYLSWAFSILSGITLLIGVIQSLKSSK